MACKTCDHTMQRVAAIGVFWCPRCGSLKREFFDGDRPEHEEPKIVHRALTFCKAAQAVLMEATSPYYRVGYARMHAESPDMRALKTCEVAVQECCLAPRDR